MKLVMFAFFIVNLSSCSALLLGGVSVVETVAKRGRPTCKEIEEVCSIDMLLEASLKERDKKNSATDWSVGVSTAPSSTYENFAKAEQIFSHTKSNRQKLDAQIQMTCSAFLRNVAQMPRSSTS